MKTAGRIFLLLAVLLPALPAAAADWLRDAAPEQLQRGVGEVRLIDQRGNRAIELTGLTPPKRPNHNTYLKFRFRLKRPVDMNGRTLRFRVSAPESEQYGGVIVNLFNAGEDQPAWNLMRWDRRLFSREPVFFQIAAGVNRTLVWQGGGDASRIDRVEIMFGSPHEGVKGTFLITDLADGPETLPGDPALYLEAEDGRLAADRAEAAAGPRFSGGRGVRLKSGVEPRTGENGETPDLVLTASAAPGHYLLYASALADDRLRDRLKRAGSAAEATRIGIRRNDDHIRHPNLFFPWNPLSAHAAYRQFLGDIRLTGGDEHAIGVFLPAGALLDHFELVAYTPPPVPAAARSYIPSATPRPGHPRVLVNPELLPLIRERLNAPGHAERYETLRRSALAPLALSPHPGMKHDLEFERTLQNRAFYFLIAGDAAHGRETAKALNDYITAVDHDNSLDITRAMGHLALTAALVYDWCYELLTAAERDAVRRRMLELSACKEDGYPPFKQMAVNGHGNEMQFMRDFVAMALAVYDEDPEPWRYAAYRILEEVAPMHGFEFESTWHN